MINKKPYIIVVDDDLITRELLNDVLIKHDFKVDVFRDGQELFRALKTKVPNLIVLDLILPGDDGLTILKKLRENSNIPVIMLTTANEDVDKIIGIEMGADDYLGKPFNPRELVARIKSVLRRTLVQKMSSVESAEGIISFETFTLDSFKHKLLKNDVEINLSSGEYEMLLIFIKHAGRVLTREQLLYYLRGEEATPFDRSIDIQVSRLRKKIEEDSADPKIITTVRGGGYIFVPQTTKTLK
ncbi:MAG: response regulator [Alphaproteobacteria bacterium]